MNKNEVINTLKQYALRGLSECKDHLGVSVIGAGIGIILSGMTGWNFAASLCVGIVVTAAGCMAVFDKANSK